MSLIIYPISTFYRPPSQDAYFLDGDFTKETYEEKRKQLIQKRDDIVKEIENHDNADNKFSETLITLVELASGALETFKGSDVEGKRKMINLVFANLQLKGRKLEYTLRPPFDSFAKCTKIEEWRTVVDDFLTKNSNIFASILLFTNGKFKKLLTNCNNSK